MKLMVPKNLEQMVASKITLDFCMGSWHHFRREINPHQHQTEQNSFFVICWETRHSIYSFLVVFIKTPNTQQSWLFCRLMSHDDVQNFLLVFI